MRRGSGNSGNGGSNGNDTTGGSVLIRGGALVLPGEETPVPGDLLIRNGVIAAVGDVSGTLSGARAGATDAIIDATGMLVFPGVVDPHVHFDEPGFTDREDFYHGTSAAASGGVTTVIDMPCTSIPPVTNLANFREKYAVIRGRAVIDYGFYGGVSAEVFTNGFPDGMRELAPHVLGFKTYFISAMEKFHHLDHFQFHQVLREARLLGIPVLLHAEDYTYSVGATAAAQRGEVGGTISVDTGSAAAFYRGRPEEAEVLAIGAASELAWSAEGSLHIVHVSTARGAEIIAGNPFVTGETCPHYLAFTTDDFERIGSAAKVTPPIKPTPNREALWRALERGTLSFVASDHAPAPTKQKNTGSIWTDYAGIPGSGTLFPFLYSEGYLRGHLSLNRLAEVTSSAAAARYGLTRKGALVPGRDGDCLLLDPNDSWTVRGEEFLSKGKVTPFEGATFQGRIRKTICRGTVVYDAEEGIVAEPGYGQLQHRDGSAP